MQDETEDDGEQGGGGSISLDVVRSYLAFARRAIKARRVMVGIVLAIGLVLTVLIVRFVPKTYTCTTVLMAVETAVLDGDRGGPRSWAGASGLIMRHENLTTLIKETGLLKKYSARRPPLLAFKDRIFQALGGPMDDKTLTSVLVGTLETKLTVTIQDDTLEITVNWSDPVTAAELAAATKDSFLRIRHHAETSAFQEKMAILEAHAGKLREEIDTLAIQLNASLQVKAAEKVAVLKAEAASGVKTPNPTSFTARRQTLVSDEQIPELRERLAGMKAKLATAEADRNSRLGTERAKLDELKVKFTSNHPQVMAQEERLGLASQVSSDLALLRSETADLESQIHQREGMARAGTGAVVASGSAPGRPTAAEPLPSEILSLLNRQDADPAVAAQMSGAVVRYGSLRDEVRGAKIALDTAQAAFNHRYQVVIPVEVPSKHAKPNLALVGGACFFLFLLVALALPIGLELRRGVLEERWQVDHFQLPVLAELRLPERSDP